MALDADQFAGEWAKRAIRAEMARRSLTYDDLAHMLDNVGAYEDPHPLRNKVARATFSASFFVQCLAAMGVKTLNIDLLESYREAKYEDELEANDKKKPLPSHKK